jgi:phosphatidylglycerol lysyltransferase
MDFLIARLAEWAQLQRYEWLNLGMAPLVCTDVALLSPSSWGIGLVRTLGKRVYNFGDLRQFKAKFGPQWRFRYFAAERGVSTAISLLDLAWLISGRNATAGVPDPLYASRRP